MSLFLTFIGYKVSFVVDVDVVFLFSDIRFVVLVVFVVDVTSVPLSNIRYIF